MRMEVVHHGGVKAHEGDQPIEHGTTLLGRHGQPAGLVDAQVEQGGKPCSIVGIKVIGMQRIVVRKRAFHHVETPSFLMVGLGVEAQLARQLKGEIQGEVGIAFLYEVEPMHGLLDKIEQGLVGGFFRQGL